MKSVPRSYFDLLSDVKRDPDNLHTTRLFFDAYEKQGNPEPAGKIVYLQLKFLSGQNRSESLNRLARYYLSLNKPFLAYTCLSESLRINPGQDDIFGLLGSLERSAGPKFPEYLLPEACTVSVIMATYNRQDEIKESIESVIAQTFSDFELVIINDGGSEEVEKVVRLFDSEKIKYYRLESNRGLSGALNEGVLRARGKYIAYLDDDDIYFPNHLEKSVRCLEKNRCEFVYGDTRIVKGSFVNGKFNLRERGGLWRESFDKNALLQQNYMSVLSLVHRKRIFAEVGLFNQELTMSMDWEMWLRSSLRFRFCHIDNCAGEYRIKDNNMVVADRLGMKFHYYLINSYYNYFKGNIALAKYQTQNKFSTNNKSYIGMRNNFSGYFKTAKNLEELFNFALFYRDSSFSVKILPFFLYFNSKSCLKRIRSSRSSLLIFIAVLLSPGVLFFKSLIVLRNRISRDVNL